MLSAKKTLHILHDICRCPHKKKKHKSTDTDFLQQQGFLSQHTNAAQAKRLFITLDGNQHTAASSSQFLPNGANQGSYHAGGEDSARKKETGKIDQYQLRTVNNVYGISPNKTLDSRGTSIEGKIQLHLALLQITPEFSYRDASSTPADPLRATNSTINHNYDD